MSKSTQFNIGKIFVLIGLVFSISGTIIIWMDSQNSIHALSVLLENVATKIGYWQDNQIEPEKINDFNQALYKASHLDLRGFILLMFGFLFQGFSLINFNKQVS